MYMTTVKGEAQMSCFGALIVQSYANEMKGVCSLRECVCCETYVFVGVQ